MEMKGKNIFTKEEAQKLRELISLRVKTGPKEEQKKIRDKMRKISFYGSDYGIRDCQLSDFEGLISCGAIKVIDEKKGENTVKSCSPKREKSSDIKATDIKKALIDGKFRTVSELTADDVTTDSGLYCIKLNKGVRLPAIYGKLEVRDDGIIYIGQASCLRERLWDNELHHKHPATFFRGIGAILGYLPKKGSLVGKANQNNYRFNSGDTEKIIEWIKKSLLVNWTTVKREDLDIVEGELIRKYCPVMNNKHNPYKSEVLEKARAKCREVATSQ